MRPDKICGKVVKGCKEQLVTPMLRLFQFSPDNCIVPSTWKTSEIVPVPKTKIPLSNNDLMGHCIELKYYADGIHSGLTPPG